MRRKQVLVVFIICLWAIHLHAQGPTANSQLTVFSENTMQDNKKGLFNENTINHLSFLLNTQHYAWSPTERYSIRSKKIGFRLDMILHYPDSILSYKINIPRLMDVIITRDTIHGIEGYHFNLKMADSVIVEYSGAVAKNLKTDKLSFFITGAETAERLRTIFQNISYQNNRRWYLEAEREKETTICPPNQN